MKRCLWMIFMVVGICMLTGCSSDDDKLDSLLGMTRNCSTSLLF